MINFRMIGLIGNGRIKFQPAFFALVMSMGILSISSLLNGFNLLSNILFYTAVVVFIAEAALLLAWMIKGGSKQICGPFECGYGAFTISSALSVLLTRLSMDGLENFDLTLATDFAILVFIVSVIRPGLLGKIRNSSGKVDSGLSNYPIAILAYSIVLLHSFPDGTHYSDLIAFAAVLAAIFSMLVFFRFQKYLFIIYLSEHIKGIVADGSIFINMGFPALCSIFIFQATQSFQGFLSHTSVSFLLLLALGLWMYSTVWYPLAIRLYLLGNRTHDFRVSKFAIIFPTGVYSTATYFISRAYFHELQILSIVALIAGIIVLLVILGELISPPFAIHRKTAEP
jgi:tellurite resistance protein TehA-like permease